MWDGTNPSRGGSCSSCQGGACKIPEVKKTTEIKTATPLIQAITPDPVVVMARIEPIKREPAVKPTKTEKITKAVKTSTKLKRKK